MCRRESLMKILLYQDNTLNLNLDAICSGLRAITNLEVARGRAQFRIKGRAVRFPATYEQLSAKLINEGRSAKLSLCFTKLPYDNNYFFESKEISL